MLGFKKKKLEPRKYLTHWELQTRDVVATIAGEMFARHRDFSVEECVDYAIKIVEEADRRLLADVNKQEGRL